MKGYCVVKGESLSKKSKDAMKGVSEERKGDRRCSLAVLGSRVV
jgi:hypothetical protein